MNKKIKKSHIDCGFGFPVQIINAPFKQFNGEWALDLNFENLERSVLFALSLKPARITGNEIRFIRQYFEMDLRLFGARFGNVAHSAVIKWEKFKDEPTNMNWATEKDIRLAIVDRLKPRVFRKVYADLEKITPSKSYRIKVDSADIAA